MRVVIAGGTGFLGRALAERLSARGDEIVVLSRHTGTTPHARLVEWTPDGSGGPWARELAGAAAVVNLAGASIEEKRWTPARKQEIRSSRVLATRSLVSAIRSLPDADRPNVFVQGSAVGFYGTPGAEALDESSPPGADFLASVVVDWETEARAIEALHVRLVIVRSGIPLALDGGALPKMMMPFRFFVGGRLGTGAQYLSWIDRGDWLSFISWAIETPAATGAFNATAPAPATNAELSRAIGRAIHRPNWLPVPALALRVIVGPMANDALLNGQRVLPKRALEMGFTFQQTDVARAIADLVRRRAT
jgi:uncharacterized protein (TIGR01777 family)